MSDGASERNQEIEKRLADTAGVVEALRKAGRAALEEARLHGVPVPIWRNGRVEHVAAEVLIAEEFPT